MGQISISAIFAALFEGCSRSTSETKTTLISESSDAAMAIGYVHDRNQADQSRFGDFLLSEPNALCLNCSKYKNVSDGMGQCSLLREGFVKSGGWCSFWLKA